jgi:citrate synthase
MNTVYRPGLEGIVAAETRLSTIDGQAGELVIAGFPLERFAPYATFEETVYLLWHDRLPTADELTTFSDDLARYRAIPPLTLRLLEGAAERKLPVMDALCLSLGSVKLSAHADNAPEMVALAAIPTIIAAYWRALNNQAMILPREDLSHAANYLYMLTGDEPTEAQVRALDTYLNTVVEHGLNASTFTARVIIATQSDVISALVGAVGTLKGPLHGGAPGPALDMVFEIGEPANAEGYIRAKLERGERLMGFGHRVYKVRDPRADVLNGAAQRFFDEDDDLYALARHVEQVAIDLLEEYKPGRRLQTNVEYYTALVLHGLGLPTDLFSPTFAVSRTAGWIAHIREQQAVGRLIRPTSRYIGDVDRQWVPRVERSAALDRTLESQ